MFIQKYHEITLATNIFAEFFSSIVSNTYKWKTSSENKVL